MAQVGWRGAGDEAVQELLRPGGEVGVRGRVLPVLQGGPHLHPPGGPHRGVLLQGVWESGTDRSSDRSFINKAQCLSKISMRTFNVFNQPSTRLAGSDVIDPKISESLFGSSSGNKRQGRKFYWDGSIETEVPNKVQDDD